ncbi:MAG: septum formation initiator family protein [Lactobacillus sp.]|nr:septum formation initiator family protein [Lactobacillus sp.]
MTGPRLYNSESPEAQQARLIAKRKKRVKEVHRVRRNRIIAIFLLVIVILGYGLFRNKAYVNELESQKSSYQTKLEQLEKEKKELKNQRDNLLDNDYLGKLVRNRFYYSRKGEKIYHLPDTNSGSDK